MTDKKTHSTAQSGAPKDVMTTREIHNWLGETYSRRTIARSYLERWKYEPEGKHKHTIKELKENESIETKEIESRQGVKWVRQDSLNEIIFVHSYCTCHRSGICSWCRFQEAFAKL